MSKTAVSRPRILIYKEGKTSSAVSIPWLPQAIAINTGEGRYLTYDILDAGEVDVHNGKNLGEISWEGILPGARRGKQPFIISEAKTPKYYDDIFNKWKEKGTKLKLVISGAITANVYLTGYESSYGGAFGDIEYSIRFKIRRELNVTTVKKKKKNAENAKKKNKSPKKKTEAAGSTYIVKSGDTLWKIAANKLGSGAKYTQIYQENKTIIEKTAKDRGLKSSDGGHWIFPGTKLKIPAV